MTTPFRYRFADAEFDEAQGVLWIAGRQAVVERLPLQLLSALLRRPDEVVTRTELFDILWQGRPTVDHVLANAVSKLRRALGDPAGARLVNIPRVGYRLVGPIERLAVGRRPVAASALRAGQPVPGREDFVLLHPSDGSGGEVWIARHRRLGRMRVFKFAHEGERLAALKREFTVGRLLAEELGPRDDLVPVEDCNFSDVPFFLAYPSAGVDLRTWVAAGPHFAAMPLVERIALFVRIARVVAAAHGVGVLHRDLKPGNVLIEEPAADGAVIASETSAGPSSRLKVRLIDFGSSRLLMPERLAALGVTAMGLTVTESTHPLLGSTPHYFAPELLAGQSATTRSDLYALGLILYQFVVADLARPLVTAWEDDVVDPLLIDDIRAATDGRPERRLSSVDQLVERLERLPERHAAREAADAVSRQMAMTAARLERSRARRPWVIAIGACVVLGTMGATGFALRAQAARHDAEVAGARTRAINEFLNLDLLQSASALQASPHSVSLFDLLNRASDRAAERFKDDPVVLAQVRRQLGDIYLGMSFDDQAETQYRRAIVFLEAAGRPNDPDLLAARFGLARALVRSGDGRDAMNVLEQAGPRWLSGSSTTTRRALLAWTDVLVALERDRDALPLAERLVTLSDALADGTPVDLRERTEARLRLCELEVRLGDVAGADRRMPELQAPPFNVSRSRDVVHARAELETSLRALRDGRRDEAERRLIALRDQAGALGGFDGPRTARLQEALSTIAFHDGRYDEALTASRAALDAYRSALGEQHGRVTLARLALALCELESGHADEALAHLATVRKRLDADPRNAGRFLTVDLARARALTTLDRPAEAIDVLEGLGPVDTIEARGTPRLAALIRAELGRALLARGRVRDGRALLAEAVAEFDHADVPASESTRYRSLLSRSGGGNGERAGTTVGGRS